MDGPASSPRTAVFTWTVYLLLAILVVTEKFGLTTSDTRLDMTDAPTRFLRDTFSLWNPRVSLGELQNQAYGYLFPQGPFFALMEQAHVPGWVAQRVWSVLLLVVACEGARRVTRAIGVSPWASSLAGLAYGLNPRSIAELGVRSAEILPGAVLPWALLPVLHAVNGRLRPRTAALLSAAAFACGGGVNGTATAAPAALLAVFVVWAVLTKRLRWSFGATWAMLMVAVNLWWALALVRLGAYSPPFFDYVEDARATTATSGFAGALRGASNWVNYIVIVDQRWWPAGYDVSLEVGVSLAGAAVAALGVVGLLRYRGRFRVPLILSAGIGLSCLSMAHVMTLGGPFSGELRDLLDGPLAPLRNVPKADPILRLPLAVGVGLVAHAALLGARRVAWARAGGWRRRAAAVGAVGVVGLLGLGLLGSASPVITSDLRTPGWEEVPDWWGQAADYLDDSEADGVAWIVPASGFGIQTWGWTMEEPMQVRGSSKWVTRSQVPLTPAPTLRMLSSLESYLSTGAGSPYLRNVLRRVGIDRVVVRHDLDPDVSLSAPPSLVSVALARSPGIERAATFGALDFGPAIEVFDVRPADGRAPSDDTGYQIRDVADARTVASSVEDVITAAGAGLAGDDQVMMLPQAGWDEPVDIEGDGFRRRERSFGRVEGAESNVMAPDDAYRGGRVIPNYPGPPDVDPVVARYEGITGVTASSASGYADVLGEVRPSTAPWSALDGDPTTTWVTAPFVSPRNQWIDVDLGSERPVGEVRLTAPQRPVGVQSGLRWRVSAGDRAVVVTLNPFTGEGVADLGGVVSDHVRATVISVGDRTAPVGLSELQVEGVTPGRTLALRDVETTAVPDFLFTAAPESRACVTTLLGPDCDLTRSDRSEEATGIDRTVRVPNDATYRIKGIAIARTNAATATLLDPIFAVTGQGSSWLDDDPTVAPRMSWDQDPTTSWVADPRDREPTLSFDLGEVRTLDTLNVTPPATIAQRPTRAVIRGDGQVRTVDLTGYGSFEPLRARNISITFSRPADSGTYTIGVGEVQLGPYDVGVPLIGAGPTGAPCGFGPPIVVDGVSRRTAVRGLIGDVVSNGQLAVVPCDGPVELTAGEHRLQLTSTEQFQPVTMRMRAIRSRPVVQPSRTVRLVSDGRTHRVLDVSAGQDAVLSYPQNLNAGWRATIDGKPLRPLQVDGWAQGWRVPAGVSGTVVLDYTPQRGYLVLLIGGLVLLGLVLVAAVVVGLRARLVPVDPSLVEDPERPVAGGDPWLDAGRRRMRLGLAVVAAAALGGLVGGPIVAAGALLGVVLAAHRRFCLAVVVLTLGGAVVVLVVQLAPDRPFASTPVDLATGAGTAFALAAGLARRGTRASAPAAS